MRRRTRRRLATAIIVLVLAGGAAWAYFAPFGTGESPLPQSADASAGGGGAADELVNRESSVSLNAPSESSQREPKREVTGISKSDATATQPADAAPATSLSPEEPVARSTAKDAPARGTVRLEELATTHVVQPGESLKRIARRYHVTEQLLARLNGLSDLHKIQAGARLKVIEGPFRAVIDKSAFRMDIFHGERLAASFRVGMGVNDGTPTGAWRVFNKLVNPEWTNPQTRQRYAADDPKNPIGEHWLGLEGISGAAVGQIGFGIHGTIEPETIGKNASLGCIRLLPEDVATVFEYLVEGDSIVEVK